MVGSARADDGIPSVTHTGDFVTARYDELFAPLMEIIERARVRAYQSINRDMMVMYWDIGAHLHEKTVSDSWGKRTITEFSAWIQRRIPGITGFSPQNLWRMKQLFETYHENEKLSPLVREIP